MADVSDDHSGLGCLWIIGWTFVSFYAFSFALLGFEMDGYPETDATTLTLAPEEIVLLGLGLLFWLSGISVWFTVRWVRQARRDDAGAAKATLSFATLWAAFQFFLVLNVTLTSHALDRPYQPATGWFWVLEPHALPSFLASVFGSLWAIGVVGWHGVRGWLWRSIDG